MTRPSPYRWITARFPGYCQECRESIYKGETVLFDAKTGWLYCPTKCGPKLKPLHTIDKHGEK